MTSRRHDETRLTSGACEFLDDLMASVRDRVLEKAEDRAIRLSGEITEITVRDVIDAASSIGIFTAPPPAPSFDRRTRWLFRWAWVAAAALLVVSVPAAIVGNIGEGPPGWEAAAAIGVAVSTMALIAAAILLQRLTEYRRYEPISEVAHTEGRVREAEFMRAWIALEGAVRAAAAQTYGESRSSLPLSRLAQHLAATGLLTTKDIEVFRQLQVTRNGIVHGRSKGAPAEAVKEALRLASAVGGSP